jgi:tRNA threonylcarbamoyladenosine biosynthesis protein TsaE
LLSLKTIEHRVVSSCPEDTLRIGVLLGQHLANRSVVALTGELGSGKTCLAQGIARGLGVPEDFYVTSPSYALVNEYQGRLRLFHVDLYRVQDKAELEDIGLEEIIGADGVTVIEWADKLVGLLPDERLCVSISIVNEQTRALRIEGYGCEAADLGRILFKGKTLAL